SGWRVSPGLLFGLEVSLAALRNLGWVGGFEFSPIGVYAVELFVAKKWETVFVDDRVLLWQAYEHEAATLRPLSPTRMSSIILAKAVQKAMHMRDFSDR
ncbi:unnamed protein product, partial [Amoebophrya sp. A25]